jgi:hypothetical protein
MKQKVFLFLSLLLTTVWGGARAAGIPQAIWCYDTQTQGGTFYFVNLETSYHAGDTFQGKTVTAAWRGDQVSALSDSPGWQDDAYRKESLKDGDGTSYLSIKTSKLGTCET